jgi:hypothetical protein
VELLEGITAWMTDPSAANVYWLSGAGGTGKTTACHSVAKIASELGYLGATLFSSDVSDDDAGYSSIIPTLAYQLAVMNVRLRSDICTAVSLDPGIISSRSRSAQARKLLSNVLKGLASDPPPCLLIILDALDECQDASNGHGEDLTPVVLAALRNLPFVKVFITSRKGPQQLVPHRDLAPPVLHCDMVLFSVHKDIERYFRVGLTDLQMRLGPRSNFVFEADIYSLSQQSAGLFLNARSMLYYICNTDGSPQQRLQALVNKTTSVKAVRNLFLASRHPARERSFAQLEFAKHLDTLPTYLAQMKTLQQVCAGNFGLILR